MVSSSNRIATLCAELWSGMRADFAWFIFTSLPSILLFKVAPDSSLVSPAPLYLALGYCSCPYTSFDGSRACESPLD